MPTYDYRCKECGHELEAQQAFTDDPLTDCPACGASALRKRFGSVGIAFKGSGFYKTDNRSSGSTKTAAPPAASGASSGSSGSSESSGSSPAAASSGSSGSSAAPGSSATSGSTTSP